MPKWESKGEQQLPVYQSPGVCENHRGYSDQSWMYGIALEGMAQASQLLHRAEMPGYLRRAADWVFANPREWGPQRRLFLNQPVHSVMLTPGLAYIAETSGEPNYWDVAMEGFQRQTEEAAVTDRLKLFAQLFRNSQRYLWYLSVECTQCEPPGATNVLGGGSSKPSSPGISK